MQHSENAMVEDRTRRSERVAKLIAFTFGLVFLFLPLILVHFSEADYVSAGRLQGNGSEVVVGIAVVLRATLRRLLRAGTSQLVRTSAGAFSRMAARAFTRRIAKTVTRIAWGLLARNQVDAVSEAASSSEPAKTRGPAAQLFSLALGFVAIVVSFRFILAGCESEVLNDLTNGGRSGEWWVGLLAAVPLLVYALAGFAAAAIWSVRVDLVTAFDGLLLQAYFTGAGSFLPMTSDMEFEGNRDNQWKISMLVLGLLYACHLVCAMIPDSWSAAMLSSFFLIHCFVYSFPIPPLEGHDIWARSKLVWGILWIPVLVSFVMYLPESLSKLL